MVDAIVVGSGPNGLSAAVLLAQEGVDVTVLEAADTIGGGTRTEELTVPGVLHDVCSAIHPFGGVSPFFASVPLAEHGLRWLQGDVDLAHPLPGGRCGVMVRSLDDTVAGLGVDGPMWRRTFARLTHGFDEVAEDLLQPILHLPHHPLRLAAFGARGLLPTTVLAKQWKTDEARALFGGISAHAIQPLSRPTTSAVGLMFVAAAHRSGWPVAAGGSRSITDALASLLRSLGGTIETGVRVRSLAELPPTELRLLDVSPRSLLALAGNDLPPRMRRAYGRYRYGPGTFKLDLAVQGDVPWTAEPARRATTVHVGGTLEEVAASEASAVKGVMPDEPFLLVAQQHLVDPSRSAGDIHPLWAYCHVPHGWTGDATEAILRQIERFAPGVRDQIVGLHTRGPADLEAHNANYVGGDIAVGATDPVQILFRPRVALDPYATGIPGTFLCSSATPPGAGVHGMCGANAARSAIKHLRRAA